MSTTLTPPESVLPVIKLPAGDITVDDIVRVKQDIAKEIEAIRKKSANSKPSIILDFGKVKSTDPAFITDVIFPLSRIANFVFVRVQDAVKEQFSHLASADQSTFHDSEASAQRAHNQSDHGYDR